MISPTLDTLRLFLHVLAASVWVGGQIVLGGLVPRLRAAHPESLKTAANGFARVAWPAYGVTVVTGIWNILEVSVSDTNTDYQVTLFVHVLLAVATAIFAAVHSLGRGKLALAIGGALGLLTGLGAMFVGLLLRTGG
jgi:putative copper export protein